MRLDLTHRVQRDADDDQERRTTEVEWNAHTLRKKDRQYADRGDVDRTNQRKP